MFFATPSIDNKKLNLQSSISYLFNTAIFPKHQLKSSTNRSICVFFYAAILYHDISNKNKSLRPKPRRQAIQSARSWHHPRQTFQDKWPTPPLNRQRYCTCYPTKKSRSVSRFRLGPKANYNYFEQICPNRWAIFNIRIVDLENSACCAITSQQQKTRQPEIFYAKSGCINSN